MRRLVQEVRTVPDLCRALHARQGGASIGLVPTMGYLHRGHLALAERAREENDLVVMSIFVNPTQFGPAEDFARYPRDLERDRSLAEEAGVDVLFVPDVDVMYPRGPHAQTVWVVPEALDSVLCGASRPGHFRGVCTVVAKLFHMVLPDRAYFGQKDAQQAIILQRMVDDLAFPVKLCLVPTVREADGLALSSRNVYLSPAQRQQAPALYRALQAARTALEAGETDAQALERIMRGTLASLAPEGRLDYATVADLHTLQPVQGRTPQDILLAVALYLGQTRLIDNMMVTGSPPAFQ